MLEGEIVIVEEHGLDFDQLHLRLHSAASRVRVLSQQSPTSIAFFDVLAKGDRDLRDEPFRDGHRLLEKLLSSAAPPIHLTPATSDQALASISVRASKAQALMA